MVGQKSGHVRKLIITISRSSSKLGQVGSKIRLLGQILEKPCVHFRGQIIEKSCVYPSVLSFDSSFMKLYQNVNHHNI